MPAGDDTRKNAATAGTRSAACRSSPVTGGNVALAIRIRRRNRALGQRRGRTVTVDAIPNLTAYQASPAHLADYIRGQWGIEMLYDIRDTT